MYLTSKLLLLGVIMYALADDICLNKTEYDFYIIGNLVKDFENRIHVLRQNVEEIAQAKCQKPKLPCPDTACADEWVSYNGSCYFFENTATYSFEEARALCKQKGSVLLYVENEAEESFIRRMIQRFKSDAHWYNGLSDQSSEGHWKWIDTNIITKFTNWAPGQPEGGTRQNCNVNHNSGIHQWHDTECTAKWFAICKKEK